MRVHISWHPLLFFFYHSKGNKGGVSVRMTVFGHPVCFLNCHLPAHMRNLEQRMEDFESILQQQQFDGGTATGVLDHEWVTPLTTLSFIVTLMLHNILQKPLNVPPSFRKCSELEICAATRFIPERRPCQIQKQVSSNIL